MRWLRMLGLVALLQLLVPMVLHAQPASQKEWVAAVHGVVIERMRLLKGAVPALGEVLVRFELGRDGRLIEAKVVKSAPDKVLDDVALMAFGGMVFPAFSPDMTADSKVFTVPIRFAAGRPGGRWRQEAYLRLQAAPMDTWGAGYFDTLYWAVVGVVAAIDPVGPDLFYRVSVRVVVAQDGSFAASIAGTSGSVELDDAVLAAVKHVRLPPFDPDVSGQKEIFTITFALPPPPTERKWLVAAGSLIQSRKTYPDEARAERLAGTVQLSFLAARDGTVTDVRIERGQHRILDRAALAVFEGLHLPPMPEDMAGAGTRYHAALAYGLPADEAEWEAMATRWLDDRLRYPENAGASGALGTVETLVVTDPDGRVLEAKVLAGSGDPALDAATVDFYRGTRLPPFSPDMGDRMRLHLRKVTYDSRTRTGFAF